MTVPDPITSMELSIPTQTIVLTSGKTVSFIPVEAPSATTSTLPPPASPDISSTPIHSLKLAYSPSSASIHPILGDRFTTGSVDDPWVRVHDFEHGEEREVYKGHHGPVHCVEYSPDGEMYASGSEDGQLSPLFTRTCILI
jgi:serine-threonine kinase receptor-associated protein